MLGVPNWTPKVFLNYIWHIFNGGAHINASGIHSKYEEMINNQLTPHHFRNFFWGTVLGALAFLKHGTVNPLFCVFQNSEKPRISSVYTKFQT